MKPTLFDNLSTADAAVMTELAPILDIAYVEPLKGGSERKFYVETTCGERRLVRIGVVGDYGYEHYGIANGNQTFAHIAKTGLPVTQMLRYGYCGGGALYYQFCTWLDGECPVRFIHHLSPAEQYALGVQVGETARLLHTLPALPSPHKRNRENPWCVWWKEDLLWRIKEYESKPGITRVHEMFIKYLQDNIDLVDGRPQTFIHGDWNTGNYIFMPDGKIGIIDTGATGGDPWMEFRYSNGINDGPYFDSGQINGYFGGNPPAEYFPLLLLYTADSALYWNWEGLDEQMLAMYDEMRNPVPSWYSK